MTTPLVTEYGVHWNFFFSLVGVSLLKFFIRNVGGDSRSVIVLFVAYEAWVELCGGREWILGAKRDGGFVDQNREGVLGLGGSSSRINRRISSCVADKNRSRSNGVEPVSNS